MAVAITQTADPASAGSGTTITYSGVSIGVADSTRVVVVGVTTELTAGAISSATIDFGGGAQAMSASTNGAQGAVGARVFWLPAATGTTADIAITFAASQTSSTHHITVYRAVDADGIASSSGGIGDTDADPISSGAITIPTDGGCIAVCAMATDTTTRTWTGITEDTAVDADIGTYRHSAGFSTTAGTPTITVSGGNGEDGALAWLVLKKYARSIVPDTTQFTFSGSDVSLERGREIVPETTSFAFTGTAVTLLYRYIPTQWMGISAVPISSGPISGPKLDDPTDAGDPVIIPEAGAFSFTGSDVSLEWGREIFPETTSFAFTGQDVSLEYGREIFPETTSFAFTGQDVPLEYGREIFPETTSFTFTGSDVSLEWGHEIFPETTSFTFTGQDVPLEYGREIFPETDAFLFTGSDVTFDRTYIIYPETTSFTFTGSDVSLEYGREIFPETVAFAFTGSDVSLEHGREIFPEATSFTFTGQDVSLEYGREIFPETTSFVFTGQDVPLEYGREIFPETGAFLFTGTDATFDRTYTIYPEAGAFLFTGSDVALTKDSEKIIIPEVGAFLFTGSDVSLELGHEIFPEVGEFLFTGSDVSLELGREIFPEAGEFLFSGSDVTLVYVTAAGDVRLATIPFIATMGAMTCR
jgi:hypothetical protein